MCKDQRAVFQWLFSGELPKVVSVLFSSVNMSVLGEGINKKDVQIWKNLAFDDGDDSDSFNLYNNMPLT